MRESLVLSAALIAMGVLMSCSDKKNDNSDAIAEAIAEETKVLVNNDFIPPEYRRPVKEGGGTIEYITYESKNIMVMVQQTKNMPMFIFRKLIILMTLKKNMQFFI